MISILTLLLLVSLSVEVMPACAAGADSPLATGAHDVDIGEVRLHYVVRGRGPLVFIVSPGWGVGSSYLQNGLAPLEKHFTLIFMDTRGSGGSTRPADSRHMSHAIMADDIEALRQKLAIPTLDLLGHSDGGTLAIEYAERHPQQVRKLMLIDPAVIGDRDGQAIRSVLQLWADDPQYTVAIHEAETSKSDPTLTDAEFERSLGRMIPLYLSDPSRYLKPFVESMAGTHLSAYAKVAQEAAEHDDHDQRPDLKLIQADTLIINGTVDWVCPFTVAQRLHTAIARSHLSLYANRGHFPWIEAGPRFFEEVSWFLSRPVPDSDRRSNPNT
jgi:proline iminopeptidase